ncbi:MAG: hypothetical protein ACRC4N_06730 [Gammaproteobacteria bacterium]
MGSHLSEPDIEAQLQRLTSSFQQSRFSPSVSLFSLSLSLSLSLTHWLTAFFTFPHPY